jgi:type I restriction enzyme S subunit
MAIEKLITDHLDLWTAAVRPKSSAGRGSNSKLELTGIKKLRELILELAVRGKLVPQDPSDEPASVLLERIAAEKARLVKEGKIKKPKALPQISEEEKPFELPAGWEWSMLAEIAAINPRNEIDDAVDASFVPMSLISTSYNGQHEFEARKWGEIKKGFTHFSNGDIGIAKITPCFENSKAAVFRGLINGIGAGTTELHIARPYTGCVSALFILLNVKSPIYLKKGEAGMTGTAGQKRLAKDFFSFYPLPIPPLAEQKRIVAKVDELMALCDQLELRSESQLAAHQALVEALLATLADNTDADELAQNWARLSTHFDTLFTTEASIDALKQTILQLAVMGKLVPQDPSDEPASVLLERISAEKAQLVREGEIKSEKQYPVISDAELPHSKPDGWVFERFGNVLINRDFERIPLAVSEREKRKGSYDYYGASGVIDKIDGYLFDKPLLLIGEDGANLINRSSPIAFIARGKYWVNNHAHVLDGLNEELLKYVCLHINAISLLPYITGTAQPKMNQAKMNAIVLGIPPLAEQKKIVAKVDELMALCDQLKSRLQTSQQTQLALAESLVEGALS